MSGILTEEDFIKKYLREGVAFNSRFRKYLFQFGLKENKCEICGASEWQGKPLMCQVHHINGNQEYPSILEASKASGVSRTYIMNSINEHSKCIDNCVWKYAQ